MTNPADARGRRVWSLGAYPKIAPHFLPMAAHLVETAGVEPGDRVLDVGCGTGNVAITLARRGVRATGLDLVPAMLEASRDEARTAGVEVEWQEGSATALPFADDTFDGALSCVGHVFAHPPEVAGRELLRVTRPGGRIAFTSWTPECVIAAMGRVLSQFLPPDPDPTEPPFLWGDPEVTTQRLGNGVEDLDFRVARLAIPVLSPAHYWQKAVTESGLFIAALERVEETRRAELRRRVVETIEGFFDEGRNVVPLEYRLVSGRVAGPL